MRANALTIERATYLRARTTRALRKLFAVLIFALALFRPSLSSAEPAESRVTWNEAWPKFRWWEYGVTAGSWGTTLTSGYVLTNTPFGWRGRNDFDEGIRDGLRFSSSDARLRAASASDIMFYSLAAYPILVDGLIVTLGAHRRPDVAWQLVMIDIEALGVAGFLSSITERTGRERPYVRTCTGDNLDPMCSDTGRNQSFMSGHTAGAFAGAGLICVHHNVLDLYRSRAADVLLCSTALGTAVVQGYLRLASDVHYTTDVIAAAATGLGAGIVFPYLLHFRTSGTASRIGVAPLSMRDAIGISVYGPLPDGNLP